MTNRQARREQAKSTRTTRPTGGGGPTRRPSRPGAPPPRSGGGPADFLSRPFVLVVAAVLVAAVIAIGWLAVRSSGSDDQLVKDLETAQSNLPADMAKGAKLGNDDAPIKLTMFEDFQCPFCLKFTAEDEPGIIEEFVKTGKVQLEYRQYPIIGTESFRAASASECAADQNKFWQYHNLLFLTQAKAGQATNEKRDAGRFSDDNLKKFADEIGLDRTKFDQCLNDDTHLSKVTDDTNQAKSYGISGTPGFLINGQPTGGDPGDLNAWREFLNKNLDVIANATATAKAGGNLTPTTSATTGTAAAKTTTPATTTTPAATTSGGASPSAAASGTSAATSPSATRTP